MADLAFNLSNGRKSSGDRLRYPPGFCRKVIDAVYDTEDPDRPHKIPGRTALASLPGGATAANTKGLDYLSFANDDNYLVLANQSKLHEAAVTGVTLGAWASVQDLAGSPNDFVMSGDFVKAVPDTLRRNIVFTGALNERPLVRDEDGNWRYLGFKKPAAPTLAATTGTPSKTFPSQAANPGTVDEGTVGANFDNTALAYDDDNATYASKESDTVQVIASNFLFPNVTFGADQKLNVKAATSSLPLDWDWPGIGSPSGGGAPDEPLEAVLIIRVSIDNGSTYETIYTGNAPTGEITVQHDIAAGTYDPLSSTGIVVQVVFHYRLGTALATAVIREIWAQDETAGSPAVIDAGTFYYAATEIYSITLASGKTLVVESAPSDVRAIVLDGSTHTGVTVTPGAQMNGVTDGVEHDTDNNKLLARRIYRSTKSGNYPDLGLLAQMAIDATDMVDTFEIAADTLGSPGVQVVFLADSVYPLASQPPAIYDATEHDGMLVTISSDDRASLKWSAPNLSDYFPVPQSISLVPRGRNDDLMGVLSMGSDVILVWSRTRLIRIGNLPIVGVGSFDLSTITTDVLSYSEGLAGNPRGYCQFHSQKGHLVVGWVSDNGVWMTDGARISERGLGLVKLSSHIDWPRDVDTTRLAETSLVYDPVLQSILFDYYAPDGTLVHERLHTSPLHWVPSGQDQMVPKWTGPHTLTATSRTVGEEGGLLRVWSLDTTNLQVLLERLGEQDASSDILTHIESEWVYPGAPRDIVQVYFGEVFHSDWGAGEVCEVDLQVRDDRTGVIQPLNEKGVSLRGEAISSLDLFEGVGRSFKLTVRHLGKTSSLAKPIRALGPVVFEAEQADEVRG